MPPMRPNPVYKLDNYESDASTLKQFMSFKKKNDQNESNYKTNLFPSNSALKTQFKTTITSSPQQT